MSNNKETDLLKFRIRLIEGLVQKHGSAVPTLDTNWLSVISWPEFPWQEKKAKPWRRCVMCIKHGKQRKTIYWCEYEAGLWLDWCFTSYQTISTSNLLAFLTHKQDVQLIRQAVNIIICSALCEEITNYLIYIISYKGLNISMKKLMGCSKNTIAIIVQYWNVCTEGLNTTWY